MMLSRVAERVYWSARYLERVASTARLISIYQSLLFDLPTTIKQSWYNLIEINDLEAVFAERYSQRNERNVVKFLLFDDENYSSLLNSLKGVRENVRTTRDVVPEEAWELICELCLFTQDNMDSGIDRRTRHEFLETIIKGCLQISGLLYSTMPHNEAWEFYTIGSHLERADMTSRYLEAGLGAILELEKDDHEIASRQIIWGSVLRSLNATQYYLHTTRTPVKGSEVIPYLLYDNQFPKSVGYCLQVMIASCAKLPNSKSLVQTLKDIELQLNDKPDVDHPGADLLLFFNRLQILLNSIHSMISKAWFPAD